MMPELRARAGGRLKGAWMSDSLKNELLWGEKFLRTAVPRVLSADDTRPAVLVFTDAALEGERDEIATYGGVILDGAKVVKFGGQLSRESLAELQVETKKVITVLEVLPAAAVAIKWKQEFTHRRVFFFIDNDAARAGLIKQYSDSAVIQGVLRAEEQLKHPCFQWFCRVASSSNVADEASRLKPLLMFEDVAEVVDVSLEPFFKSREQIPKKGSRRRRA